MNTLQPSPKPTDAKARHSLLPGLPLDQIATVIAFGARSYGEQGWRHQETVDSCIDAIGRHLSQHEQGNTHDEKSGLPHLAHAGARLLMALWHFDQQQKQQGQ